ncbi:MAG: ATP-binding protein [Propionibacteriaceae bacterium]|jgi:predicted AAA+ superfamily ATPase|nr:ATP-binding protein [Propionibacteriaceae bacterium]
MDRDVMTRLRAWKTSAQRKPLLLEGARQVGKTWLMRAFGCAEYDNVAYIDFEANPSLCTIFDGDIDVSRILSQLQVATATPIVPGRTLIILDEIQACPRALTALKYVGEQAPGHHIAGAGSLLGVALHQDSSFPVGKVNFLDIGPLSFTEFLRALGEAGLADALDPNGPPDWVFLAPFHDRLITLLRDYCFVGGMPEAVSSYASTRDYGTARAIHEAILRAYDRDFSKHAPIGEVPRLRAVWASIPGQLARERRFAYGELGPGARARTHLAAIEWLTQAGVVHHVTRVSVPRLPLREYVDESAFKLYLVDVGLLGALAGLGAPAVIEGDRLFTEFRGSLTEQYAATALVAATGRTPHYWTNDGGTAEVDFVVQRERDIVPVEVRSSLNLKSKSLGVYDGKYAPDRLVRSSLAPYAAHGRLVDLPLYGLGSIGTV